MMVPHVLLVFLCPLAVVVVGTSLPEPWDCNIASNYALFWKHRAVVRDSDGSSILATSQGSSYEGKEVDDESTDERDDEDQEDFGDRSLEGLLDEPKATSKEAAKPVPIQDEEKVDTDPYLDMRVLLDDKLRYRPYESTVYLHFYRRDDHAFVDLKFDPCSDLDYYSDAWKDQGCNHTALTTTEELSSAGEASDASESEGEDKGVTSEDGSMGGTPNEDYFDETGTYVGPDYSNNRLHPDGPDGGGWRLSQAFVVDKKTNTTFRWENPASTLGVNHDLDFLFCEAVKFTLTADGEDDTTTTTTATMSFENVLFSAFLDFMNLMDLRWTSRELDGYVGMRITSPCQEDEICEAVNGNVACLATADSETTSRKDYFANITTLEYVDGVVMEEA